MCNPCCCFSPATLRYWVGLVGIIYIVASFASIGQAALIQKVKHSCDDLEKKCTSFRLIKDAIDNCSLPDFNKLDFGELGPIKAILEKLTGNTIPTLPPGFTFPPDLENLTGNISICDENGTLFLPPQVEKLISILDTFCNHLDTCYDFKNAIITILSISATCMLVTGGVVIVGALFQMGVIIYVSIILQILVGLLYTAMFVVSGLICQMEWYYHGKNQIVFYALAGGIFVASMYFSCLTCAYSSYLREQEEAKTAGKRAAPPPPVERQKSRSAPQSGRGSQQGSGSQQARGSQSAQPPDYDQQ